MPAFGTYQYRLISIIMVNFIVEAIRLERLVLTGKEGEVIVFAVA
jgi:hypothetical protein